MFKWENFVHLNSRKKKIIVTVVTIVLFLLGIGANIASILGFFGINLEVSEKPNTKQLDIIGSLGYSMGMWETTRLFGVLPNDTLRKSITDEAAANARKLNLYLNIEELNSADTVQAKDIFERLTEGVYRIDGNRGRGMFEIRYNCALAELFLAWNKNEDEQITKFAIIFAAAKMSDAASVAEQVGAKKNIVLEGKSISKEILDIQENLSNEKLRETTLYKVFGWESNATKAMYEITP